MIHQERAPDALSAQQRKQRSKFEGANVVELSPPASRVSIRGDTSSDSSQDDDLPSGRHPRAGEASGVRGDRSAGRPVPVFASESWREAAERWRTTQWLASSCASTQSFLKLLFLASAVFALGRRCDSRRLIRRGSSWPLTDVAIQAAPAVRRLAQAEDSDVSSDEELRELCRQISRAWGRDRGQPLTTTPVGGSPCGFTDEARSDIKRPLARQWTAADSTQPGPFAAVPEGSRGRGDIRSDGDTQSATGVWLARSRLAATDASVGFQPVRPTQCESRSHTRQGRHSRRVASSPSPPLCRKGERRSREEAASALPATAKRHRGPDSFPPPPLDAPRAPPLYYTEGVHGFSRLRTRAHLPVLSPIVGSPLSPSWSARGSSPPSKTTPASARPPSPASPRIPPAGVVRSPPLPGSPPPNPPFLFTPVLQVSGGYVPQTGGPLKRKRSQERGDSPEFGEPCRKVWGSPWVSWRKGEPVLPPSPGALWSPSGSPEGLQSDSD